MSDPLLHLRRQPGTCQDCGNHAPVRLVMFWLNGFKMYLCARCEKGYRRVLLK